MINYENFKKEFEDKSVEERIIFAKERFSAECFTVLRDGIQNIEDIGGFLL
jgi:hypothetical protein